MDVVLLRKLSRKSILGFGKYKELSVQQMINLNHTAILRWYYYNSSNITFLDDILDEIHISEKYKIKKPGVDKDMMKKRDLSLNAYVIENNHLNIYKRASKIKKDLRLENIRNINSRKYRESKYYLQSKNHGH